MLGTIKNFFQGESNTKPVQSVEKSTTKASQKLQEPESTVTLGEIQFPDSFASYSKVVKTLAGTYSSAARYAATGYQRDILEKGFNAILANPDATKEEKTIAQLGLDLHDNLMASYYKEDTNVDLRKDAQKACFIFMEAMSGSISSPTGIIEAMGGSISGPTGIVLAKLYNYTAACCNHWICKNIIIEKGFNALLANPNATKEEKNITKVALEASKNATCDLGIEEKDGESRPATGYWENLKFRDVYQARSKFMEAITNGGSISKVSDLAKLHCDAAKNCNMWDNKNVVLKQGFKAILASSEATEDEKTLAKLGIEASEGLISQRSYSTVDVTEATYQATIEFMEAIINGVNISKVSDLAQLYCKATWKCSLPYNRNLIVDKGFKAILSRPDVTKEEKNFIKLGLEASEGKIAFIEAISKGGGIG
jgi:hypothetical protein